MNRKKSQSPFSALVLITAAGAAVMGLTQQAHAAELNGKDRNRLETSVPSERMEKRFGTFLAIGEPAPGILGLNVAYNVVDYLRATAGFSHLSVSGFGADSSTTTLALGAKGFVPGWSLTPTVGLHVARVMYSGTGLLQVGGVSGDATNLYTSIGGDYQAKNGFNAGVGYNLSLNGVSSGIFLNLGWFFGV